MKDNELAEVRELIFEVVSRLMTVSRKALKNKEDDQMTGYEMWELLATIANTC